MNATRNFPDTKKLYSEYRKCGKVSQSAFLRNKQKIKVNFEKMFCYVIATYASIAYIAVAFII